MSLDLVSPRSLPLDRVAERHWHAEVALSVAAPAEYPEVEALARTAGPDEVFKPLTAPLLSWFTERNPAGPGFLVVARSRADGRLLGHFLFYANRLEASHATLPAYLYVHLYVSPGLRRRGVFGAMFAFGLDVLVQMGVPFAYTVPNPRSSPGFVKFGVPLLGTLPCRMAPTSRWWGAAASVVAGRAEGRQHVMTRRVERFDEALLACGRPLAGVRGAREAAHLNWRFAERPGAEYGIFRVDRGAIPAGYVVTRVLDIQRYRVLTVCDLALEPFDAATLRRALDDIQRQLAGERAQLVMLQGGPPDRASRRALAHAGLLQVPNRLLPQPVAVFGGAPARRGSTAGLPLLDDWCLTPCDWDVF